MTMPADDADLPRAQRMLDSVRVIDEHSAGQGDMSFRQYKPWVVAIVARACNGDRDRADQVVRTAYEEQVPLEQVISQLRNI